MGAGGGEWEGQAGRQVREKAAVGKYAKRKNVKNWRICIKKNCER
jgi:hypothetical protein